MKNSENGRTFFILGVAAAAAGACLLGLSFLRGVGVYMLISSVIACLGALAFFSAQKKRENFRLLKVFTAVTYVITAAALLLFLGGLIYSAAG